LHRQREDRAKRELDVVIGRVPAEAAEQIVLGDTELRVFAQLLAAIVRRAIEEMRRPLGEILRLDPARADQRPIDVMFDHPLERPCLRALLAVEPGVEIEAIFTFDMGADEGGVGDALGIIVDIGQLPFRGGRRHRPLLAIG